MTFTELFEGYLNRFRLRLRQLTAARGAAIMAVAAITISLAAVTLAIRTGFPDDLVIVARIVLFASLVLLAVWFIVLPNRRIERGAAHDIESRTPAFGGRVETWVEMQDSANPMRELLAEDTLKLAERHPPERQVLQREFTVALSVAGVAVAALLFFAIAGPGNYSYGVRHLWAGWAVSGLLPPQSIDVEPGDDGIRMGGTLRVRAVMQGFEPARAHVHARFGDGEWQQVEMAPGAEQFDFTFFSVRERLEYYVTAANVRSQTFEVRVVDVPNVDNLAVTYHFPEWTGRDPRTDDPGGDVRTIAETEIEVEIRTDRPMTPGDLIVDDEAIPLDIDADTARARFTVQADGQYYVAARVGGEHIRLTDDYFVSVLDDEGPVVEFLQPGRDWSASSIEEVTARISAHDDFAIESLELRYSINGGEWQTVALATEDDVPEVDHVFYLESLSQVAPGGNLVPGDLISYYAVATDREQSSSTDIFFVDVQPFDRRYSQSQAGGMPGQQGGAPEQEISQRQREIIVSTWNLIREQKEKKREGDAYVTDNATLLSRVQETLRNQVATLAARTQARQLTLRDEDIAAFVENLNKAAEAMIPASERLGEVELEEAILPEQEALQHLLAAEAVFTDINVTLQANNRGGGGQAGRDLTEMFELEMDLEKNQYETGSAATPEPPQQQLQEAEEELGELARRQEQLARNLSRTRTPTPAQRWQQDMLRRDVEELRDRLERMQQQAASQSGAQAQSRQGGQQGDQQSSQGAQSGQPSPATSSGSPGEPDDELRRRLDSAVRAMRDADEAMRQGADLESLQRAAAEAQRQLEGARDRAAEEQQQATERMLTDLNDRADDLHARQADIERRLQEAMRDVLVGRNEFNRLDSGMTMLEEYEMAREKRDLQTELQALEQDIRTVARQIAEGQQRTAQQLEEAVEKLREQDIDTRLAFAAAYIERGEAVYVAGSESAVTDSLRELSEDLERAQAGLAGAQPGEGEQESLERTLADTRALRRNLQRMTRGTSGDVNEGANERVTPDGVRDGAVTNRGRDDLQRPTGVRVDDLDIAREYDRQADVISRDVMNMFRDLRAKGVAVQDIDELRRLAQEIRAADFSGNEAVLAEEARFALSLVEQLELALADAARSGDGDVRANPTEDIPDAHREVVADYYRRLGQTDVTDQP